MDEKKITVRVLQKGWEFFKKVFPGESAYSGVSLFIEESLQVFKGTISELKLFSKDEVSELIEINRTWELDFSRFPAKQQLLNELDDHYRINKLAVFPEEFKDNINSMTEFQCYVLVRWCKALWVNPEKIQETASHFFEKVS